MSSEMVFTSEGQVVGIGAHVCAMHENPGGVLGTIADSFRVGLEQNERCAYVASEESSATVRQALEESGVDVAAAEERGDIIFMTDREPLLKDGEEFDPDYLMDAIKGLFGSTLEAGYQGLRLSADVPWIARDTTGGDRMMEFEALADDVTNVPGTPLLAICQYRLSQLDPEDSLEILERHPLTLIGGQIHLNDRYAG